MAESRSKSQSLRLEVAAALRERVLAEASPGDRLPPERTLAKQLGVSVFTLREALSALAEEGWLVRRQGSGTYVSDDPPRRTVGVLIELDISHPRCSYFYLRVTQQVRRYIRDHGYRARLYVGYVQPGQDDPGRLTCDEFLEDVRAGRVDVTVAIAVEPKAYWTKVLEELSIPIVGNSHSYGYGVQQSTPRLATLGARALISQGCKRIACISWGRGQEQAIREELAAANLPIRDEWFRFDLHPNWPEAGAEEFYAIWQSRDEKPDGLVVTDDVLFNDAAAAIQAMGIRIPEQLKVAAHVNRGNEPRVPYPLTMLEVDPDESANAMGEIAVRLLEGKPLRKGLTTMDIRVREAEATNSILTAIMKKEPLRA